MRTSRLWFPGAVYHVTVRTNRKDLLLEPPLAKELFVSTLARAKKKYKFEVWNFVVMNNHVHLLLRFPIDGNLPDAMRWLLGVYAMNLNRRYGQSGHVWGDRYYSRPISCMGEYRIVSEYIDLNPVRSALVADPDEWVWGGRWHRLVNRTDVIGDSP